MEEKRISHSIYSLMSEVGVEVPQLVEAGLELLEGVEKTDKLEISLEKQIRKSLEDINVVVLIVAGIRVEDD